MAKVENGRRTVLTGPLVPPANIGPRSTPNYEYWPSRRRVARDGSKVFAGPRDDPAFVDWLVFDLGRAAPVQPVRPDPRANRGRGGRGQRLQIPTGIVLQVPIKQLTGDKQENTPGPTT